MFGKGFIETSTNRRGHIQENGTTYSRIHTKSMKFDPQMKEKSLKIDLKSSRNWDWECKKIKGASSRSPRRRQGTDFPGIHSPFWHQLGPPNRQKMRKCYIKNQKVFGSALGRKKYWKILPKSFQYQAHTEKKKVPKESSTKHCWKMKNEQTSIVFAICLLSAGLEKQRKHYTKSNKNQL